jgi:hypothetical protein
VLLRVTQSVFCTRGLGGWVLMLQQYTDTSTPTTIEFYTKLETVMNYCRMQASNQQYGPTNGLKDVKNTSNPNYTGCDSFPSLLGGYTARGGE